MERGILIGKWDIKWNVGYLLCFILYLDLAVRQQKEEKEVGTVSLRALQSSESTWPGKKDSGHGEGMC